MGMMAARGRKIFFADADRAMPFTEFQKINEKFEYLHDKYPDLLVIGSRAHLEKESIAQRSLFRTILMKVSSWGIISYIISSPVWCCASLEIKLFRGSICASGYSVFNQFAILNVDTSFLVELLLKKFCQTYTFNDGHSMLNFYTLLRVS